MIATTNLTMKRAVDPMMRAMMGPTLPSQPLSKIHSISSKGISRMTLSTGAMMMVTPNRNFFLQACEHCEFTDPVTQTLHLTRNVGLLFFKPGLRGSTLVELWLCFLEEDKFGKETS